MAAPLFLLYPIWALVQQTLVQSILAGNLEELGLGRPAVIALGAAAFGLVHLPDLLLAGLAAAVGIAWTWIFLRTRCLLPLALSHGWLAPLVYAWVLERDPWRTGLSG